MVRGGLTSTFSSRLVSASLRPLSRSGLSRSGLSCNARGEASTFLWRGVMERLLNHTATKAGFRTRSISTCLRMRLWTKSSSWKRGSLSWNSRDGMPMRLAESLSQSKIVLKLSRSQGAHCRNWIVLLAHFVYAVGSPAYERTKGSRKLRSRIAMRNRSSWRHSCSPSNTSNMFTVSHCGLILSMKSCMRLWYSM